MKKVPDIDGLVKQARGGNYTIPLVIYNLPTRDCSSSASQGELQLSSNGESLYRDYINAIKTRVAAVPQQKFIIVFGKLLNVYCNTANTCTEPDSLANSVTNVVSV